MGGKKKSLANKLAKMSDDERARYLQHKADMEEEARRRKEQLIATFLKKKIKREEMFSRLNLAKINQHWHQLLRKTKCQEMRANVEHMRSWIERVVDYKNRTISNLMEELEEAEEQYLNNFQSHSTYIDTFIEDQHQYIEKMQAQYDEDLKQLLAASEAEKESISKSAKREEELLQTVLFGQETKGKKALKETYECYKQKEYETEMNFEEKLKGLTDIREGVMYAIWKQIAAVVDLYVEKIESVKTHFERLRKFDADSAAEAETNEERIRKQEDLILSLKADYQSLFTDRERKLKAYTKELNEVNTQFLKVKKQLQKELRIDERKLKYLSDTSLGSLQNLECLNRKGDQVKNLASTCEKLKTQREVVARWLPVTILSDGFIKTIDEGEVGEKECFEAELIINEDLSKLECLEYVASLTKSKIRPKTAISLHNLESAQSASDVPTPDSRKVASVKKVVLQAKNSQEKTPSSPSRSSLDASPSECPDILNRCLTSLKGMENFWFIFNKTEVDFIELKEEKRALDEENKQLRGMIRAVLETAALAQSIPNSKVPTRVPSKRRSAQSAPFRRVVFA